MSEKTYVTTSEIKRTSIKLPHELATHPQLDKAEVTISDDVVTFKLPPANSHVNLFADIWQYIHRKEKWVQVTFPK